MKTAESTFNQRPFSILLTTRLLTLGSGIIMSAALIASAQTIISGPTISGTWSPSGNPYIVSDNVTVPGGQTLTIQAGVDVWIGSNVTLTASGGLIEAVGTPNARITIQSAVNSYYFNTISLQNTTGTNRFMYCDFINAQTAISPYVYAGNQVMTLDVMNCTFTNCVSQAIYAQAIGWFQCCGAGGGAGSGTATLNLAIKNCMFNSTGNGCILYASGVGGGCACGGQTYGYINAEILNNIFDNLSGTACLFQPGNQYISGNPIFVNNTIVDCRTGFLAADPWDSTVANCLFIGCTNAVVDTGTLSREVQFNDFYNNATNFTGYGSTYGQWIIPNRNGTLADLLYNISQDPLFGAASDFQLLSTSPCVNAGEPGEAFANMCFPPSVGTNYDDMGAYGGPDACNWLTTVPKLPADLSLTASNHLLSLNFAAIPRSTYQIKYIGTNFHASAGTNLWLTNSTLTPASAPVSMVVSPYPPTNKQSYYEVRSMGRTPGN